MSDSARTIILAGGGSGGHLSPALAVAERLCERDASVRPIFVCSRRPIDAQMLGRAGVEFRPIDAVPPRARPSGAMQFLRAWRKSIHACRELIHETAAERVVAFGGFVAAPAVAATRGTSARVTLLNLDSPPGRANRWIARRCDDVWSAIEIARPKRFADDVVGLPLRRLAMAEGDAAECRHAVGLEPDRLTLLITGASQGATSLNQLALHLLARNADAFSGWQVLHLCGRAADACMIDDAWRAAGVPARVLSFIDEIGRAWGAADVAISRAGANSVAEIAANAVPTLFLPYPFHRDQHQRHNAQPLVDAGAALMETDFVDATRNAAVAGRTLERLLTDSALRQRMRTALQASRSADAAEVIAERLLGSGR